MMNRRKSPQHKAALDADESDANAAAKLGPDIKAKIGQQLRIMYGEVVSQGVPDRFVEILRGFDAGDDAAAVSVEKKTEGSGNEPS